MKPTAKIFTLLVLVYSSGWAAKAGWKPGDWVSWSNFRYVTSVAQDFKYLYFGTTGGILRFDKFSRKADFPLTESDGLPDGWVNGMYYDAPADELVVETQGGVTRYDITSEDWYTGGKFSPPAQPEFLRPEEYGNYFLDFGYSFGPDFQFIQDLNLRRFPVNFAYQETPHDIWLGTWGLGVAWGNVVAGQIKLFNYGLADKDVRAIHIDGEVMYVGGVGYGSPSYGITVYDREDDSWHYWEQIKTINLPSTDLNVITGDSLYIWLGTRYGLVRYNRKKDIFDSFTRARGLWDNQITALKSDGKRLWVGTSRGLNVFEPGADSLIKVELPDYLDYYVRAVEVDSNTVWIGGDRGVLKLDLKEKTSQRFIDPNGMVNTRINHILKYRDRIWFASPLGIMEYDPKNDSYTHYSQGVQVPGGEPLQLAVDSRAVWAATTNGAVRLDRQTNQWYLYNSFDGLLDNYVQTLVLEGDYIWFGTAEGLTRFHWYVPGRVE